ncbi:MAG: Holliday junction resolvase RuvX [Planctomycetes bacterium]|nr:Holliday junction resolvase RuvX [Planctomycetota bacterium]
MPEVWIGVDFGTRYVGVAVGEVSTGLPMPVKTLGAKPEPALLNALSKLAREQGAIGFVVGLPVNMNGSEGPAAVACRAFAQRLAGHTGLPAELEDERLSSWEAEGLLIEGGLTPSERKDRVHAVAASLVLKAFFDRRKPAP